MNAIRLIVVTAVAMLPPAAGARQHVIHQKGRVFSMEAVTVVRGEPVVFVNDDSVPHNVSSMTPGNSFDLGSQVPGSVTPVVFDMVGNVAVICAMHPRMRMTITVTD
jgi:plastocyanin